MQKSIKNKRTVWDCNSHTTVYLWLSRYWKFNVSYYVTASHKTRVRMYLKKLNYQDLGHPTLKARACCIITYPSSKKAFSVSPVRQVATASMNVVMPNVA
jgi:hypothetical protein